MIKMEQKTNLGLDFIRDKKKSYVYVLDEGKEIGILMWHYNKKRWVFEGEDNVIPKGRPAHV